MLEQILEWKNEGDIDICESLEQNGFDFATIKSVNGYTIIEVFEVAFFIEGHNNWHLVKI